jgi:flagellar biosynthesis activator protein FlaF
MSTTAKQVGSYSTNQRETENVRETEARALINCASRLVAAQDINNGYEYYIDAIKHNQELWTLFQVMLADPQNPLPRDLKITLLNLSRYVDKVSLRASAEYNPELLNSLIDINKQIAAGLSVTPSADAPASAPA